MGQQVSELRKVMWKETYDIRGFVVDALYAVEKLAEAEFRVFYEKVRYVIPTQCCSSKGNHIDVRTDLDCKLQTP